MSSYRFVACVCCVLHATLTALFITQTIAQEDVGAKVTRFYVMKKQDENIYEVAPTYFRALSKYNKSKNEKKQNKEKNCLSSRGGGSLFSIGFVFFPFKNVR